MPTMCQALFCMPETVHKWQSSWPHRTYILLDSQAINKEQKRNMYVRLGSYNRCEKKLSGINAKTVMMMILMKVVKEASS